MFIVFIYFDCRSDKPTSSGFYARRLTFDHRAEDEGEQERIKAAGGFVTRGRYAVKRDIFYFCFNTYVEHLLTRYFMPYYFHAF